MADRLAPTLSNLPPEIKLEIVRWVHESTAVNANGHARSLSALSLVNREFSAMVKPWLWQVRWLRWDEACSDLTSFLPCQTVDFHISSNAAIEAFIRDIAPRHGQHVTTLCCTHHILAITQSRPSAPHSHSLRVIQTSDLPIFTTRCSHYTSSLPFLPNLTTITLDLSFITHQPLFLAFVKAVHPFRTQLRELKLVSLAPTCDSVAIANLIAQFPRLRTLRILVRGDSLLHGAAGVLSAGNTIAALEHLEELWVDDTALISLPVVEATWKAPLKRLILSHFHLSMAELLGWMGRFEELEELSVVNRPPWIAKEGVEMLRAACVEREVVFKVEEVEHVEVVDDLN